MAQVPTTAPSPSVSAAPATTQPADPLLGKQFRSRADGIQFNPPAGGGIIRDLSTGDIVRFVNPTSNWDVRVKPIVLSKPMGLAELSDLTADQLAQVNQAATVLTHEVRPMGINGAKVGLIEARYIKDNEPIFAQEAIIRADSWDYFAVVMSSPGQAVAAAAAQGPGAPTQVPQAVAPVSKAVDAREAEARKVFAHMVATVVVFDRKELLQEQEKRIYQTKLLWVQLDRKKLLASIQPLHFMRILKDGKDIGFVQIDERLATHGGREGIEYIVHSRVETGADQMMDAARAQMTPADAAPENVVVSKGLAPTAPAGAAAAKATNLYTDSTYFVTFDRKHEDWTTTTQVDQQVASQLTEMGNSDLIEKVALNGAAVAAQMKAVKKGKQPPTTQPRADFKLEVSQYSHGGEVGKPVKEDLPWPPRGDDFYLPQVMGQMLPRLLPNDETQYLFATYVSNQQHVMLRYVDVGQAREVTLDDQVVRGIPISDRIGVDGIPTIHYVSRTGEWLGSVNEQSKLTVLPADVKTLKAIWKEGPREFKVCPLPDEAGKKE